MRFEPRILPSLRGELFSRRAFSSHRPFESRKPVSHFDARFAPGRKNSFTLAVDSRPGNRAHDRRQHMDAFEDRRVAAGCFTRHISGKRLELVRMVGVTTRYSCAGYRARRNTADRGGVGLRAPGGESSIPACRCRFPGPSNIHLRYPLMSTRVLIAVPAAGVSGCSTIPEGVQEEAPSLGSQCWSCAIPLSDRRGLRRETRFWSVPMLQAFEVWSRNCGWTTGGAERMAQVANPYGDGMASDRIHTVVSDDFLAAGA